ncbi:hypothetical protein CPC08DRAFT_166573 [Agrocybe pediades]|nr:hypothetical protein CPC08DRAFT_166573 [Agrocybe pediades]
MSTKFEPRLPHTVLNIQRPSHPSTVSNELLLHPTYDIHLSTSIPEPAFQSFFFIIPISWKWFFCVTTTPLVPCSELNVHIPPKTSLSPSYPNRIVDPSHYQNSRCTSQELLKFIQLENPFPRFLF